MAPTRPQPRRPRIFAGLIALLLAVAAARVLIGTSGLGWPHGASAAQLLTHWGQALLHWLNLAGPTDLLAAPEQIVETRVHRLALAVVVGSALALSGVALQALLRNPLAEPYILGLSTGAAAGMMGQRLLFFYLGLALGMHQAGALIGAAATMGIVFLVGRRQGVIDPLGLLLTGVVLATINGALIMMCNYLVGPGGLRDNLTAWMMGFLNQSAAWPTVATVAGATALGGGVLLQSARAMDVASLSDSEAMSLGVRLQRLRAIEFIVASALAAGAVVLAGPIAFVGLIAPHLARLLVGPRHQPLLLAAACLGATLILAADTVSALLHLQLGVGRMPIGIFTAMLGGPAFLWMLRPHLGRTHA
jgi:iron complex transport system permease protein